MGKLLTIAIPTYNRCNDLKKQLAFFCAEFCNDVAADVELVVSDNCSSDETSGIITEAVFNNKWMKYNRHDKNLGLAGNLESLMDLATTKFIWFVGDDDVLEGGVLGKVVNILKENKGVQFVFLNHDGFRENVSNKVFKNAFNFRGGVFSDGKKTAVMTFLESMGTLMFITAGIHRKENLLEFKKMYNCKALESPLFYAFAACAKGVVYWESDIYVHDRLDQISWKSEHHQVKMKIFDVLGRLTNIGYARVDVKKMNQYWFKRNLRSIFRNLRVDFFQTIKLLKYFNVGTFAFLIKRSLRKAPFK